MSGRFCETEPILASTPSHWPSYSMNGSPKVGTSFTKPTRHLFTSRTLCVFRRKRAITLGMTDSLFPRHSLLLTTYTCFSPLPDAKKPNNERTIGGGGGGPFLACARDYKVCALRSMADHASSALARSATSPLVRQSLILASHQSSRISPLEHIISLFTDTSNMARDGLLELAPAARGVQHLAT